MKTTLPTKLRSKALQVNLEATDRAITIDPRYEPLKEVVKSLPGLHKQTQALLYEVNHPFKNWAYVVQELRNYALRHFPVYQEHRLGPQVIEVVLNEWLASVSECGDPSVQSKALDSIVSFVEKVLLEGTDLLRECVSILSQLFRRLIDLPPEPFFLLASGYYQIKRIGHAAKPLGDDAFDFSRFNPLLRKTLSVSYTYWLQQEDPTAWFPPDPSGLDVQVSAPGLFEEISHPRLRKCMSALEQINDQAGVRTELEDLLKLPDYSDITRAYRELPFRIEQVELAREKGLTRTLQSLLKIMQTKGLSSIHEDALGRLNRCFAATIGTQRTGEVEDLLTRTFDALKQSIQKFPEAALQALENLAKVIFDGKDDLLDLFVRATVGLGFQCPEIKGTTTEWKVEVNPVHLANIKAWLHIVENDPKRCKKLISALIIHLKLAGVYIKDTDLFQKEISRFLNSPIAPVYNLAKQLARLFPVYFNEINAEGELRDVSTEVDELSNRKDVLIHFLRKQSHVESNNLLIDFTSNIITFWRQRDKSVLAPYVPPELLAMVKETGPQIDGVHQVVTTLFERADLHDGEDVLKLDMPQAANLLADVPEERENDRDRVLLVIRFLKLLDQKYNLIHFEIERLLKEAAVKGLPSTQHLQKALQSQDVVVRLQGILDYLKLLKQIILSSEHFAVSEDIYRKRHIAADIPSMYGTYQERKFDALGFTFRLENLANVLFEKLIETINLNFLTRTTFIRISDCMHLLFQAMELDGIVVEPLKRCLTLLTHAIDVRRFSFTQYLDIFREFSRAEQHILNAHYTNMHKENLGRIIRILGAERLLPKYGVGIDEEITDEVVSKVSETFFRDIVATAFGFQYLDNFVSKVRNTLWRQSEELSGADLDLLLSYDPQRALSEIKNPLPAARDPITLGTKGFNLVRLAALNMPVPNGFVITTEVFRCLKSISAFRQADKDLRDKILFQIRRLESFADRGFGSSHNPLLLSVRSGAAISLPGMMNTFLNVGLNERIAQGLVERTGKAWFAWDNYRRFLQSWGMSYNMERDVFDAVMNEHKARCGITHKRQFAPDQMRELALDYRDALAGAGVILTDDPYEQLFEAMRQVFLSWNSDKAKTYRDIMGISDDWGTAVIVQGMVYGNLSERAGSGVVFTHNPNAPLDKVSLWGDYTMGNQGEDVVAGLVRTDAISMEQKTAEGRDQDLALEETFPEVFVALKDMAKRLVYERGWGPQEIEFTFEGETADKLYLLQSRDMVVSQGKLYPVFVPTSALKTALLAKGIGVSGGALCGKAVFTLDEISLLRRTEPQTPLILIRFDTVPDDIKEISAADGLLTSRGGATSHASIVAHQLEKTCVVGCAKLVVQERAGFGDINGYTIRSGDLLSIDGQNGFVYKGRHETTIQPGGTAA